MPSEFEQQLTRLLHLDADHITAQHDVLPSVKAALAAPARQHQHQLGMRLPLVALICCVLVVALLGVNTLMRRFGNGVGGGPCIAAQTLPAPNPWPAESVTRNGLTAQVTDEYVSDAISMVQVSFTGSSTIMQSIFPSIAAPPNFSVHNFVLQDSQGDAVVSNGGEGGQTTGSPIPTHYDWIGLFHGFAHDLSAGNQSFVVSFSVVGIAAFAGAWDVAFHSSVVNGVISKPTVKSSLHSGLTLQLLEMSIDRSTNKYLPGSQILMLHLRMIGLTSLACDTAVDESFYSTLNRPLMVGSFHTGGGYVNGESSHLTLTDGTTMSPSFADFIGEPPIDEFGLKLPAPYATILHSGDPGQLDLQFVYLLPQVPQTGTVTFTLDNFYPNYSNGLDGANYRHQEYLYHGPWTLTIPLS